MDTFTSAYIECALWSSGHSKEGDNEDTPFDKTHSIDDISKSTIIQMIADCEKFQKDNGHLITEENYNGSGEYSAEEIAGHHFWLTRNRHGAGFWDGDWKKQPANILTKRSEKFGEFFLYLGDDGKISGS